MTAPVQGFASLVQWGAWIEDTSTGVDTYLGQILVGGQHTLMEQRAELRRGISGRRFGAATYQDRKSPGPSQPLTARAAEPTTGPAA
jgi:hypothetical protein